MQLTKGPTGFKGSTTIPWDEKIAYKFIVDGQWMVVEHEPTELDHDGNVNNVYTAPPKPPSSALETDSPVLVSTHTDPAVSDKATGEPEAVSDLQFPQIVADTVAAREGTVSALNYLASGVGAAIHGVVGIDPINAEQIAFPSPNPDTPSGTVEEPVPEVGSSVTPDVPVAVAPVVSEDIRTVTDPVLQTSPEVSLPTASTVSTEGITGLALEEPSTAAAIVSTTSDASAVDETAVISSDSGPSATHAGSVLGKPPMVTTPRTPSTYEPVIVISASPETPPSKTPAELVNGTSSLKLDSSCSRKTTKDVVAPNDSMLDEKILQVKPASPPVDGTEGVKPLTVQASGSQTRSESHTNGHDATPATVLVVETQLQTPSAPTTPAKKSQQSFPSSSSNSPTQSFASKAGTDSRKKKTIFSKVKHLFSHDKDKEKEKK